MLILIMSSWCISQEKKKWLAYNMVFQVSWAKSHFYFSYHFATVVIARTELHSLLSHLHFELLEYSAGILDFITGRKQPPGHYLII